MPIKGKIKMVSLREAALAAEPTQLTKNISELKKVNLDDCNLEIRKFKEGQPDAFEVEVIVVDGIDYRVPKSVKIGIQDCLTVKPDMKEFSVVRKGTTKNDTEYTVVAL